MPGYFLGSERSFLSLSLGLTVSTRVLLIPLHHTPRYFTRQRDSNSSSSSNNNNNNRRHATAPGRKVARRRTCPWQTEWKRVSAAVERPRATRHPAGTHTAAGTVTPGSPWGARARYHTVPASVVRPFSMKKKNPQTCVSAVLRQSRGNVLFIAFRSDRREIGSWFLKTIFFASSRTHGQTSRLCAVHILYSRVHVPPKHVN